MWRSEQEMRAIVRVRAARIRRRRKGRAMGGIATVLLVLIIGGAIALATSGNRGSRQIQVGTLPGSPTRALPASPLSARAGAASIWTGSDFLVWGGVGDHGAVTDGASYDPATRTWTRLQSSPLAGRQLAVSVWTGSQWILWGGEGDGRALDWLPDGATYTPATGRWRTMPPPPAALNAGVPVVSGNRLSAESKINGTGVWIGSKLLVVEDTPGGGSGPDVFAGSYDPAARRWAVLPKPPCYPAFAHQILTWTGHRAVLLCQTPVGGAYGDYGLSLATYDPTTNTWAKVTPPARLDARPDLVWDGHAVLLVGIASWNPATGDWKDLGRSVLTGGFRTGGDYQEVWTGRLVLVVGPTDGARRLSGAYDPATNTWSTFTTGLSARAGPAIAWTGTALLTWGGYDRLAGHYYADGSAYQPPH